ncbi:MAG: hypothetical protein ACR2QJ_17670 [Geminicoccaceae bacterium]
MKVTTCVVLAPLVLAACSHPTSNTYDAVDVGRTIETTQAAVVSSRVVDITGETNAVGPAAGGIAAASTTGAVVSGSGSGLLAIVAGLVGAGAGYLFQQSANDREGIEYVLKMDDGRTVTLVQNREGEEEPLPDGSPVLVQLNGKYTRVISDPTIEDAAGEIWVDPDRIATEAGNETGGGNPTDLGSFETSKVDPPTVAVPDIDEQQ